MTQSTTSSAPTSTGPTLVEELEAAAVALLAAGPQLVSDVSTGSGGLQKVTKVGGDLLNILNMFQQATASHPAVTQS